jgi:acetyl esterase
MDTHQYVGVEPATRAFLERLAEQKGAALSELPLAEARELFAKNETSEGGEKRAADIEEGTVPGPHGPVEIRIVRPPGVSHLMPGVMFFHGGGWVFGDRHTHDRLVRAIANEAGVAVIFVAYTRPPAARYPVAIEEAYAATRWVAEHGPSIQVDPSRLAVMGDSAGGNMAAAVTLLAQARGGPRLSFQVLCYPVTDASFDTPSHLSYKEGYMLTGDGVRWSWDQYAPDPGQRGEPTASPLRAPLEQLAGLPPALVMTAEFDVLRDEGEAYARRLMEAGVQVTATRYLGTIHAFLNVGALARTPAARAGLAQVAAELRTVFFGGN